MSHILRLVDMARCKSPTPIGEGDLGGVEAKENLLDSLILLPTAFKSETFARCGVVFQKLPEEIDTAADEQNPKDPMQPDEARDTGRPTAGESDFATSSSSLL